MAILKFHESKRINLLRGFQNLKNPKRKFSSTVRKVFIIIGDNSTTLLEEIWQHKYIVCGFKYKHPKNTCGFKEEIELGALILIVNIIGEGRDLHDHSMRERLFHSIMNKVCILAPKINVGNMAIALLLILS